MRDIEPWKSIIALPPPISSGKEGDDDARGEKEFDMAMEAMEKLVMNRLWHLYVDVFSCRFETVGRAD